MLILPSVPAGASAPEMGGLATLDGALAEGEFRRRLEEGAAIHEVLVVYVQPTRAGGGGGFVPYFRLAPRTPFLAIALYRERGLRSYKAFERLLALLDEWQYRGPVTVLRDDSPEIRRLKLAGWDQPG